MKWIQITAAAFALQVMCAVALDVEVRLESYSNPDTKECGGGHCETFPTLEGICDHMFSFCVRAVGSEDCLTSTITSQYIQKDRLTFSQDELNTLGISNPLHFSGITSTNSLELYVLVEDSDLLGTHEVDHFEIPLDGPVNGQYGSATTYSGTCGIGATLEVSIRLEDTNAAPTSTASKNGPSIFVTTAFYVLAFAAFFLL